MNILLANHMPKLVFASGNPGKLVEIKKALSDTDWELHAQSEWDVSSVPETGLTFIENALIKARHAAKRTNLPVLADDSGLMVAALEGAPGIYSARYAGIHASDDENNAKLLSSLQGIDTLEGRSACFVSVMVLLMHTHDPVPKIGIGYWHGQIALSPRGKNGHGYDPLFYVPEYACTAAELTLIQKNQLSHRGKALRQLQMGLN